MTEQPDTASIRARYEEGGIWPEHVYALVNALDAARADFELAREQRNDLTFLLDDARAERDALAAIVDMAGEWPKAMARAEAAEARIAAVEALCDKAERRVYQNDWWLNTCDIRRALTEGTGQ